MIVVSNDCPMTRLVKYSKVGYLTHCTFISPIMSSFVLNRELNKVGHEYSKVDL